MNHYSILLFIIISIIILLIVLVYLTVKLKKSKGTGDSTTDTEDTAYTEDTTDAEKIAPDTSQTQLPKTAPDTTPKIPQTPLPKIPQIKPKFTDLEKAGITVGGGLALGLVQKLTLKSIQKLDKKIAEKAAKKTITKLEKTGLRKVANLIKKGGTKALERLGIKAGKAGAKMAGRMAAHSAVSLSTGPAAPFVAAGFLMFDVMNFVIDVADVGGYGNLETKQTLLKAKGEYNKEFIKQLNDNGITLPAIAGPLDKLLPEQLTKVIGMQVTNLISDQNSPYLKPIIDKIKADTESGILSEADLDDDVKMDKYYNLIDFDAVSNDAMRKVCDNLNGKNVTINSELECSYPDKTSCDASYGGWPLSDPEKTYVEFSKDNGGTCILASAVSRAMCNESNIPYDYDNGICLIDKKYCQMKAQEWKYNDDIKDYDCYLPTEQNILGMIFSDTLVNGLKQVFDMEQYEKCKDNERDDGFFCRYVGCPDNEYPEMNTLHSFCYPKCNPGYKSDGEAICYQECGFDGPININNKCLDIYDASIGNQVKIFDCNGSNAQNFYYDSKDFTIRHMYDYNKCLELPNANTNNGTILTVNNCNGNNAQKFYYDEDKKTLTSKLNTNKCLDLPGYSSINGTAIQLNDCNNTREQQFKLSRNKLTDMGPSSCQMSQPSRVADCPAGYTNNGATCGRGPDSQSSNAGQGAYVTVDCPKGTTNTGGSCMGSFGRGGGRDDVFYDGWQACADQDAWHDKNNCEKWGARVYPKCQFLARINGYDDPGNWTADGCCMCSPSIRDINKVGRCSNPNYPNQSTGLCYADCQKMYGPDYYNNGTSCWRDAHTLGMDAMTCKPDEFKSGARCYKECPTEYTNNGEFCGLTKSSYGRGVGKPAAHIRAKKRIVPYSSMDN